MVKSDIQIGDIVEIHSPGRNYSNNWQLARDLGSKWYKGLQISSKRNIWVGTKWEVSNFKEDSRKKILLIRNVFLELDLLINERGVKLAKPRPIFVLKDEDLFI